ncbi:predicted protein [Sclerotinia sclerotiorum 1980 UF-70]|uniref:Uncharacterized protein n=1 Tax=Sclerotinia sclerotiorum (strain ATCC 18683 / 1980 / Ss-1) TaxID=665079 RepID=A7F423_SCLS1|nr:predicted protein [Sclerotinia sclerotiorum 1980 UF-70]EDN97494.1 predicted protein [Sclerotinia sclerotiorum 1980 UF-70]
MYFEEGVVRCLTEGFISVITCDESRQRYWELIDMKIPDDLDFGFRR